jgi:hypothetical protein
VFAAGIARWLACGVQSAKVVIPKLSSLAVRFSLTMPQRPPRCADTPAALRGEPFVGAGKESRPRPIDVHVGSRIRLRRTLLGMSQEPLGGGYPGVASRRGGPRLLLCPNAAAPVPRPADADQLRALAVDLERQAAPLRNRRCRCPIEESRFLPDRDVTSDGRLSGAKRHHCPWLGASGGVKGQSRLAGARSAALEAATRAQHTSKC